MFDGLEFANDQKVLARLIFQQVWFISCVTKLDAGAAWTACCEAGPTGYALYWQLARLAKACKVPEIMAT